MILNKTNKTIHPKLSSFSVRVESARRATVRELKRKTSIFSQRFQFCYILLILILGVAGTTQHALAQEVLVVGVNVFGLNTNQSVASEQLLSACAVLQNDNSAAAIDLQSTCQLIAGLDENDPADAAQLQQILDAAAPEEAFSLNDSIVYTSDYQTTNVLGRLIALRKATAKAELELDSALRIRTEEQTPTDTSILSLDGLAAQFANGGGAASALFSKLGVFFSGQASEGDIDGDLLEQDTDFHTASFTFGSDYRFTDNVLAGVGVGVIQRDSSFSSVAGGTESEGINLTVFGTWYEQDSTYIDAVLDIGSNSYDLERNISIDSSNQIFALGSTDSSFVSFTAGAGRTFNLASWDLGGYLRISLSNANVDEYSERANTTGAGSGSVFSIGSQTVTSQTLVVGFEVSRTFNTTRAIVIPVIRVEYENENKRNKDDIEATLVASQISSSYSGTDRDTSYSNFALGASMVLPNGKSAFAFYETHIQHDFVTQNWLKVGFRFEF